MTSTPGPGRRTKPVGNRRRNGATAAGRSAPGRAAPTSAAGRGAPRSASRPSARRQASGSTVRSSGSTAPGTEAAGRRPKLTGRFVIVAVVAAVLLVSYASSVRAWLQQRSEITLLHSQIAQRSAAVAALRTEVRRWHDPAYVEAQAKARFGWVMPGQTGYRVIGLDGRPLGAPQPMGEPQPVPGSHRDWWSTVWSSVEAAGREPSPAAGAQAQLPATRIGRTGVAQHAGNKKPSAPRHSAGPPGEPRLRPVDQLPANQR